MAGFECTFEELDAVGEALRLDVRPFPFRFPVHGRLVAERVEMFGAAHDSLAAKGLIVGAHFSADVRNLLPVFAAGTVAIAVVGSADLCARATTDGRIGVVAVQSGATVRFRSVRPATLVPAVVRLLPAMRPGAGGSVTVSDPIPSRLRYLQPARPPVGPAQEIMRRPRSGSGYVTVTVRRKSPLTMSWIDTDVGRYVALPSTGSDGRRHVTYTPADRMKLEQSLARLVVRLT